MVLKSCLLNAKGLGEQKREKSDLPVRQLCGKESYQESKLRGYLVMYR